MRSSSGYIFGIGIGLVLLSLLNHFVLRTDLIPYITKVVFGIGVLAILAGAALFMVGSSKTGSSKTGSSKTGSGTSS